MKKKLIKRVEFRRKREGRTNYKKRLRLLLSRKPRIVIRRFLDNILVQVVDYSEKGDNVLLSVSSRELIKKGWKAHRGNIPAAYLTGLLCAKKCLAKKIKEGIVDIGMQTSVKGSSLYAVVKGMIDGGVKIECSADMLPDDDTVNGVRIEEYAKILKVDEAQYKKQFSLYLKNNINPQELSKHVEEVKKNILKSGEGA
jgi:large subunit ribosomal protein L18